MTLFGRVVDKTRAFKGLLNTTFICSTISYIWVTLETEKANNLWRIVMAASVYGFFGSPLQSLSLDILVEITFPTSECVSGTFETTFGEASSLGYTLAAAFLYDPERGLALMNWIICGFFVFGCVVFLLFFQPPFWKAGKYRRAALDVKSAAEEEEARLTSERTS